jgi:hypothetical protein
MPSPLFVIITIIVTYAWGGTVFAAMVALGRLSIIGHGTTSSKAAGHSKAGPGTTGCAQRETAKPSPARTPTNFV